MELIPILVLPVAGGALFLGLFAVANPIIADGLGRLDLTPGRRGPPPDRFGALVLTGVWSALRPRKGPPLRPPRLKRAGRPGPARSPRCCCR